MNRTILWGIVATAGLLVTIAYASERLDFPEDFAGPPLYASPVVSDDDGLVAIAFFRDPDSLPDGTSLIGTDPAARNYPLTVSGYVIRSSPVGPPDVLHIDDEEGMPIWILSSDDFDDLFADGVLTLAELEGAASLVKGEADQYVLHQSVLDPNTLKVTATGTLADGREFKVKETWQDGGPHEASITIK